jgi:hybrid cluster-associated redox disulfide protein
MENKILSLDCTVADLLRDWPETIPVFIGYRLSCVGCEMAPFDTLADVIKIYQLQADLFLKDLEKAITTSLKVENGST